MTGANGRRASPSRAQLRWLTRGLDQPGGKLPLFDRSGQRVSETLVRACLAAGWAEPWFANPLKPDWLVCRLTDTGRRLADLSQEGGNTGTVMPRTVRMAAQSA